MNGFSGEYLIILVPFSSYQNCIPRICERNSTGNSFTAIGMYFKALRSAFHPLEDVTNDGIRVFAPWIIGGYHGEIAAESRLPHQGTLSSIAIAATTEYNDHATVCQACERNQQTLKCHHREQQRFAASGQVPAAIQTGLARPLQ